MNAWTQEDVTSFWQQGISCCIKFHMSCIFAYSTLTWFRFHGNNFSGDSCSCLWSRRSRQKIQETHSWHILTYPQFIVIHTKIATDTCIFSQNTLVPNVKQILNMTVLFQGVPLPTRYKFRYGCCGKFLQQCAFTHVVNKLQSEWWIKVNGLAMSLRTNRSGPYKTDLTQRHII